MLFLHVGLLSGAFSKSLPSVCFIINALCFIVNSFLSNLQINSINNKNPQNKLLQITTKKAPERYTFRCLLNNIVIRNVLHFHALAKHINFCLNQNLWRNLCKSAICPFVCLNKRSLVDRRNIVC